MTATELKNYFRSTLTARRTIAQEYLSLDAIVDFISQSISSGIPSWLNSLTFNNNGTGAGAFTTYIDTTGALRFWNSKTNANIGNQPPTDPLVTENTFWKEVSPSDGSAIKEWAAGIYLAGLQIVFYNHSTDGDGFYKLAEPTRPFTSSNIETEITAGKWVKIGGSSFGFTPENVANKAISLASPDNTKYPTTQLLKTQLDFKEDLANKATSLASPDNTKYPTTLLLSDQLAFKLDLSRAAYSIVGNGTSATANATDITAADGTILRRKGTSLAFANNGLNSLLFYANQGIDAETSGDTLNIGGANAAIVNIGRAGQTVNILGSVLAWQATNSYVTDQLITLNRGGGASTAVGAGIEFEEASAVTGYFKTNGSRAGYLFKAPSISSYADLSLANLTANRTITVPDASGTIAVSASGNIALSVAGDISFTGTLPYANFVNGSALSVVGRSANSTGVQASIAAGADGNILRRSGTTLSFGSIDLASANAVGSTILSVANGGTGSATFPGYLLASGGTASASNNRIFNTANWDNTGGTWTSTANNQYHTMYNPNITLRSIASDIVDAHQINPTFNITSTTQSPVAAEITSNYLLTGGIGTVSNVLVTGSLSGMTPGTYTNVAPASTSGTGTGALFTVIVASATLFTSVTATTPGSGYNANETVTFNGSQFGAGSGSRVLTISTISGRSLNTQDASVLKLNVSGISREQNPQMISFYQNGIYGGGIKIIDLSGQQRLSFFGSDNVERLYLAVGEVGFSTARFTSNSIFSGNITMQGTGTLTTPNTTTNSYSLSTIGGNGFISTNTGSLGGIVFSNINQSVYRTANTVVVGAINTVALTFGGSGYSAGTFACTGGSGSGAQVTITVSGGVIQTVVIAARGTGYQNNQVLTVSGGTGGTVTINTQFTNNVIASFDNNNTLTDNSTINSYVSFYSRPTVNQTGTGTGDIIGLWHNPTLTALLGVNYAIKAESGVVLVGGSTITTGNVLVDLQSTSRALVLTRIATEGNITVPINGMTYYNSTNNRFRCYVNGAWLDSLTGAVATGWATPTGTLTRTTFDESTVTLAQLAQRVAALITDLKTTVTVLAA